MININMYNLGNYIVPSDSFGGTCIDIGCNVGSFIKKYVHHFKKIYYYEPITQCYNICKDFSQNYDHIYGHNLAAWSESNKIMNIISHFNKDSGSSAVDSFILNDEWKSSDVIQSIQTISLEDIVKSTGSQEITYLKCDCENSEYFIFMDKDISNIKYIGIEIHWQMGLSKQNDLLNHITKTHDLISGSKEYTLYNREILFKRK